VSRLTFDRRALWTTCERANRARADSCFALAEQAPEEARAAHSLLVRSRRVGVTPEPAPFRALQQCEDVGPPGLRRFRDCGCSGARGVRV
jgi:hypothetical protein